MRGIRSRFTRSLLNTGIRVTGCRDHRETGATVGCSFVPLLVALCVMSLVMIPLASNGQSTRSGKRSATVNAPEWYNAPPSVRDTLVARGKGRSNDEQVAIDKAVAQARSALAAAIDHRCEELVRAIEREGGAQRSWTREPVTLEGSTLLQQKIARRGNTWTAFVLVGVPEVSAHSVLHQRLHRDATWYESVRSTQAVRAFEGSPR
jgi:hypothetical protein